MTDKDFIWPAGVQYMEMAAKIRTCLLKNNETTWRPLCDGPYFRIHVFIARLCYEYQLHPIWVLTTLARERGMLHKTLPTTRDVEIACGFVGSDDPAKPNPAWDGLSNQLWRCIRHSSWFAGLGPRGLYGNFRESWPTKPRYTDFTSIAQKPTAPISKSTPHPCASMAEYVQLMYTDHLIALADNEAYCADRVRPHF